MNSKNKEFSFYFESLGMILRNDEVIVFGILEYYR